MSSVMIYLSIIAGLTLWVERGEGRVLKDPPEALEDWLKSFQWGNRSELNEKLDLPQYKFYSEVVDTLLSLARKFGGNYQEAMLFLREGLRLDRQFEKRLRELVGGCWLQMLLIVVLTWAFILGSLTLVQVTLSPMKLCLIGGWQLVGLVLLPCLLRHYRKKLFGDIGKLWRMLYILSSMGRVPLPRTEIFTMAGIPELKSIVAPGLSHLTEKLKNTCREALRKGGSYEDEVKQLMEELRFQEKWHAELFEKRLAIIKLGLLAVFFLPAYLAFIFLLLGDLMTLV